MNTQPESGITGHLTDQKGVALLIVLLITTGLILLGTFGSYTAQTEVRIALNDLLTKQALALAEGGLSHALSVMTTDDGLNDELTGGTGGGLANLGEVETLDDDQRQYRFHATGSRPEDGYYVRVEDNFDEPNGANNPNVDLDNIVRFISRGKVENAERTVETLVQMLEGPECAIETRGDLGIGGSVSVSGTNGCVHANQELSINGNASAYSVGPTSSDGMHANSGFTVNGQSYHGSSADAYAAEHGDEEEHDIPVVNVFDFGPYHRNLAAEVRAANGYLLNSDGTVYQGGTWSCSYTSPYCRVVSGGTSVNPNNIGWTYSGSGLGGQWSPSGKKNGPTGNGIFFVEGGVDIGSVGSAANPLRVTIIAMNSINMSGNPTVVPFTTTGRLRNILFVSGNDIRIRGTPNVGYTGAMFAHQQIDINGNFTMNGFMVIEDAGATPRRSWPGDPFPNTNSGIDLTGGPPDVRGNPSITYSGLSTSLLRARLEVRAWREVRGQ